MTNCVPRPAQSHELCGLSGSKTKLEAQDEDREKCPFKSQNDFTDFISYVSWFLQFRYVTVSALLFDLDCFKSSDC